MSKPLNKRAMGLSVVSMPLFPTLGSVQEVIELANSKIPVTHQNEMYSLLMTFQNTLLKEIND